MFVSRKQLYGVLNIENSFMQPVYHGYFLRVGEIHFTEVEFYHLLFDIAQRKIKMPRISLWYVIWKHH